MVTQNHVVIIPGNHTESFYQHGECPLKR